MVKGDYIIPWSLSYLFTAIRKYFSHLQSFTISHIYREGNTFADLCANFAIIHMTDKIFHSIDEVPKHIRGELRLNKMGLFSF